MTVATKKIESGINSDGNFSQRFINGNQVLIQKNHLGIWNAYYNQKWKFSFTCERQARDWLENFPLANAE